MKAVHVRDVLRVASAMAGRDLRLKDRRLTPYRFAAYKAARDLTGQSYPAIGRVLRRHHAAILAGRKKADPEIVARLVERVLA